MSTLLSTCLGKMIAEDGGEPAQVVLAIGGGAATVAGVAGAVWRGPTAPVAFLAPIGVGLLLGAALHGVSERRQGADDAQRAADPAWS